MKTLSIVIPAYNEEKFLPTLLEKILSINTESLGYQKEIVVVDDGSKDQTKQVAEAFKEVKVFSQKNQGKGAAVQNGIKQSSGEYVLVQDADLEYDPNDYIPMLKLLTQNPNAVIYGSRVAGVRKSTSGLRGMMGQHPQQSFGPWLAGFLLTLWTFFLFRTWITDTLTAYKIYPTSFLRSIQVKTRGFETDHELTAKIVKAGLNIYEVPISYFPRSVEEGKKIGWKDGFRAVWTLLKFRCTNG